MQSYFVQLLFICMDGRNYGVACAVFSTTIFSICYRAPAHGCVQYALGLILLYTAVIVCFAVQGCMDNNVRSLFNKVSRAEYGRTGHSRTPTLQMRAFISAATSAHFIDRDPIQFVHAIARNCKYSSGDTTSIQLQPSLAGADSSPQPASLVPAKRNGDGSIKARGSGSVPQAVISADVPDAQAGPSKSQSATASEEPDLPEEAVKIVHALVHRLAESFKACKRQLNRPPRPVAPADFKRRILENAWSLAPSHEAPFMLALSLHMLLNYILNYPRILPLIMAESSTISGLAPVPEGGPDAHPLLLLILGALPTLVWGMHGLASIYAPFLLSTIVRIACALHMRSTDYSSQVVGLAMSQIRCYRSALEANFKPTAETVSALAAKHQAFLPIGDPMASHRLQLFASILFHLTADGTRCPALSQSAVELVRSAGGVHTLPLALEAVNYARKEGTTAAVVLLAVLSRLLRAGQATLPTRIAGFARQLMRAGRAAATAGDYQESQRAMRLAGSLPAFERWTATGGRADMSATTQQPPPAELAAAVLAAASAAVNDLTALHPAMAHLIPGGASGQSGSDGGGGGGLSDMMVQMRYGAALPGASPLVPDITGRLRDLFWSDVGDGLVGDDRGHAAGAEDMEGVLDVPLDDAVDADFEEHREYMDSVLEDADQDDDEVEVPPYDAGMNNSAGGHGAGGQSSEDEMHAVNQEEEDDDEDDAESDDDGDGDDGGAEPADALGGAGVEYEVGHRSDDDVGGGMPEGAVDAMMQAEDEGMAAGHVGGEADLEDERLWDLTELQVRGPNYREHVQVGDMAGGGGVDGGPGPVADGGEEEMAMEETEAMIAEMEAEMHADVDGTLRNLAFPDADDELEEEDADMAEAEEQQAAHNMAVIGGLDPLQDVPFLDPFDMEGAMPLLGCMPHLFVCVMVASIEWTRH